ncbi:sorting nexin-1-like [Poeciliopsis prolifica]|uniref:sorting nexin-1-like n=1 Tax=Poeciliopsis prolifica TaxID=188132 RepID=UPI00072C5E8E|nr:sorting nexin-1-like [Poeciliopsis prolifica]
MATSSERSPPPFPDSEDQDALESEEVRGRDSDEDDAEELFLSAANTPMAKMESPSAPASQLVDLLIDPLIEPLSSSTNKPSSELFEDLTNDTAGKPSDVASDEFVDILGSEAAAQREEVDVTVEAAAAVAKAETSHGATDLLGDGETRSAAEQEATSVTPVMDLGGSQQTPASAKVTDPLEDLLSDPPATATSDTHKPGAAVVDLFDDEGSDIFTGAPSSKPSKQPQKSLFGEADEDLFAEPLGAVAKKAASKEQKEKSVPASAGETAHIFTEEAVGTVPNARAVNSKTNGIPSEEDSDIFAEATVELSLDSPMIERRKEATTKPPASASTSVSASLAKPQSAAVEELEEEEEQELEDQFDIYVSVKDPEKIGDGMNAYMAYKVSTQTSLPMFRNKTFTVRRRFSDFLGLYEKLSEKHGPNGLVIPPPPEKNLLGMTKMKVGKEDSSSADFLERRRGALERYLQRIVTHPMLLQDPDVREFLEKEELPRAVSTQALSGAGFLKMLNKATDAVSKMTIKMNESDVWFEEKLQEVESADQQFRKLHALVELLVVHRKELSLNTASFAKSAAMLGSAEDNTALSRALSQLAEVEDKMEQLHQDQAANDTFSFAELIADFIRLLGAVRGTFDQRMKAWQRWQDAQAMLQKKRETEAKLLWANKPDKLQLAKEEIAEWEAKVTQYERDFDRVSATVRKEVVRFEKEKTKNFKRQIIVYLESLLQSQQQLIKYWEAFLPEAKAIA